MRTIFSLQPCVVIVLWTQQLGCNSAAMLANDVQPLPIVVQEDKTPGSLMRWHLYERLDETSVVGERITLVGQFDRDKKQILLASPPWLTVAFAGEKGANAEGIKTLQVFSFACDGLEGLDEVGFATFTGKIVEHRPDLSAADKDRQRIPPLRLEVTKLQGIRSLRSPAELLKVAEDDIRKIEPQLRELCAKYELTYDFDPSKLSSSWFEGNVACTSIATKHPRFSFKPLPYATISVLYDPVTGKPTRYLFTRRIWQDPRD
jgi:hypothetical protein